MESSRQIRKRQEREIQEHKKRGDKLIYIVSIIVVVLVVLLAVVQYSGLITRVLPAVRVGNTGYSVSNANFFYRNTYASFYNTYGDSVGAYLDPSRPLSAQPSIFDYSMTWAQYFWQEAMTQIKQVTALYDAAMADGFKLRAEDNEWIVSWLDGMKGAAKDTGYSYSRYLNLYYGEGNSEKTVRAMMTKSLVADRYMAEKLESFTFDEEELARYYDENREKYDSVAYIYYWIDGAGEDGSDESRETAMADALGMAGTITGSSSSREDFRQLVQLLTGEMPATTVTPLRDLNPAYAGWLTDGARKEGDMEVFEQSDGCFVLYFIDSTDNHYNTVSVRHILITVKDTDGDGVYSKEEADETRLAIQDVYDAWMEAGGDEETFSDMARNLSEDFGSKENGGLYEGIFKNQMVDEFDAFCFQPHQYGDTGIVYGSNEYYAGYHLIFFSGEGDPYWKTLAENAKREEDFTDWMGNLVSGYEAKENFLMRYAIDR